MRRLIGALIIVSTVAGCGSKTDTPGFRATLIAAIKARQAAKAAAKKPKTPGPVLTRQLIANIKKPLLHINAQALGVKTLFGQVARNGPYRTYFNNIKMSVTFNSGIITATRGFGLDLLSQGMSIAPDKLFVDYTRPKFYTRTQKQLINVKEVAEFNYKCILVQGQPETLSIVEIDYDVIKYTETCRNKERAFKNTYWVDATTNQIWKSAQSIGKQAGFFITEVLVP